MSTTKKLDLRFDFEAILQLAEKGINILDGGIKQEDIKKPQTFLTLVWAGMLHSNSALTIEQARDAAKGIKVRDVIDQVTAALNEGVGDENPNATAKAAS